jgi:hypothetical protein
MRLLMSVESIHGVSQLAVHTNIAPASAVTSASVRGQSDIFGVLVSSLLIKKGIDGGSIASKIDTWASVHELILK